MSRGKVLVTARSVAGCEPALAAMRAAGAELEIAVPPQPFVEDWLIDRARDATALVVAMEPVTRRVIEAAPGLRLIARPGVGFDTVDLAAATAKGVMVTIADGANNASVADFTIGLMLMASRRMLDGALGVRDRGWDRPVGSEVWHKTLAIVGLGRIGRGVARRARGFDLRVLAVARRPDTAFAAAQDVEYVDLPSALSEADIVSLHLPLTAETAGLIDARALASMKPGAILINTARGGLVDEAALAAAVRSGHLAGAAVDVLQEQGAGSRSPLIGVPGIVVTPHMAALSHEATARVAHAVAASVAAVLRGQRPDGLVNADAYRVRRESA